MGNMARQNHWRNTPETAPPVDAVRHSPGTLNINPTLVGRDKELGQLSECFEQVAAGAVHVVMVTGEPGIGKSMLVHHLQDKVRCRNSFFLSGKYEQFRRTGPYSAIIEAMRGLALQLLEDTRLRQWKDELVSTLGPNGQIITQIIPEFEAIIGPQPDICELDPESTQNRFKRVFKDFVHLFAEPAHPLVIFLDDLQWVDPAGIALIQTLIQDLDLKAFMLIGAFRDTEMPPHHPFRLMIESMPARGVHYTSIGLGALDRSDVGLLLASLLNYDLTVIKPLADVCYSKTRGKPFFLIQFLIRLYDHSLLFWSSRIGWQWDLAIIEMMRVNDDAVGLLAEKLSDLPTAPLKLIQIGACIGSRFELKTLAALAEQPEEAIRPAIDHLVEKGLIVLVNGHYRFYHDRVLEAAHLLLHSDKKKRLHHCIGQLALTQTGKEGLYQNIFYIADQLNAAAELVAEAQDRLLLADINLQAGVKAKKATAYDAAAGYFEAGILLLPDDAWQHHYALAFELHTEQMACQYQIRHFDEARKLFEEILANAESTIDKARAYATMIQLYTNTRPPEDALALGCAALKQFGIHINMDMGRTKVLWMLIKTRRKLKRVPLHLILQQPLMTDERRLAYHNIMLHMGVSAFFYNPFLFAYMALMAMGEALQYGLYPHAATIFIIAATIIENMLGDYVWGYEMGKIALKLNDKLGSRHLAGQVYHVFAFMIQHWNRHARLDLPFYQKVYRFCLDHGDFTYAGHGINAEAECRLFVGDRLATALKENEKYQTFVRQVQDPLIFGIYAENNALIRSLTGHNSDPLCLSGPDYDAEAHLQKMRDENNMYGIFVTLFHRAKLFYLFGRYQEARQAAKEMVPYAKSPMGTLILADYYYYHALILTALMADADRSNQRKFKETAVENLHRIGRWAELCPENFKHKHELILAEIEACAKNNRNAPKLYYAAVETARENDFVNDEALVWERLGRFYLKIDEPDKAGAVLQQAHQCYGRWGAVAKQRHLEQLLDKHIT